MSKYLESVYSWWIVIAATDVHDRILKGYMKESQSTSLAASRKLS